MHVPGANAIRMWFLVQITLGEERDGLLLVVDRAKCQGPPAAAKVRRH